MSAEPVKQLRGIATDETKNSTKCSTKQPKSSHQLDALLHSVRVIAGCEDTLCELSHELKKAGMLFKESANHLLELLEKMPSEDYLSDLEAVRKTFATSLQGISSKKASLKKTAAKVVTGKISRRNPSK